MINHDKWINTLPRINNPIQEIDHQRWEKTIPQKRTSTSVKKYSLMVLFFVFGLLFVSAEKIKTGIEKAYRIIDINL